MFQFKRIRILGEEAFGLSHNSGAEMTVIPGRGGILHRLSLPGMPDLVESHSTQEELEQGAWSRSTLLFPFPNRLEDGRYFWMGKSYQFEINDPATGNALHGLAERVPFVVREVRLGIQAASLHLAYRYAGTHPGYPFPCLLEVSYEYEESKGFSMQFGVTNWSESPIPVGLGWHPYFQLGGLVNGWKLQMPPCRQVTTDTRMLPAGTQTPFSGFQELQPIGEMALDTCFELAHPQVRNEYLLEGPSGKLLYWQAGQVPYTQLFIPPSRRSLAIEPMSCNINAFHNQQGLITLEPGEKMAIVAGLQAVPDAGK